MYNLKTELKRVLRKHVGEAVNDVCDAFAEEFKPPTLSPVAVSGNEVDYECCRRLVEYIERNMDTSPSFATQMDCVILAYQSNAPLEVLNSVVTQNMWIRRQGRGSGGEETKGESDGGDQLKAVKTSDAVAARYATKLKPDFVGGSLSTKNKEIKSAQAKSAKNPPEKNKPKRTRKTSPASRARFDDVVDQMSANAHVVANVVGDMTSVESGKAKGESNQNGAILDPAEPLPRDVESLQDTFFLFAEKMKNTALEADKSARSAASERKKSSLQNKHPYVSPSLGVVGSRNAPVNAETSLYDAAMAKAGATGSSHPTEVAKASSRIAQQYTEPTNGTDSKNDQPNVSLIVTSRPRQWGKRKRLVTSKRPKTAAASTKRSRRALSNHCEPSNLSFTETVNSEDEKEGADKETESDESNREQQRIGSVMTSALTKPTALKTLKPDGVATTTKYDSTTVTTESLEAKAARVQKQASGKEDAATSKTESSVTKPRAKARVAKQMITTDKKSESAIGDEGDSNNGKTEDEPLDIEDDQSALVVLIDSELCQVERDLVAGDENGELDAAKRSFQAMLNTVVCAQATDAVSMGLDESRCQESDKATTDPIGKLCDAAQRSPEQTHIFKMRLRDTISIVDALLCKPARGLSCSRDCKTIRAQMCNEFTPCINPTCRTWHEAEAHSEACTDEKCEFKTRVMLRETMHLIEHKQQEVTAVCDALELTKVALFSPTRRSSGNAERIETLQSELQAMSDELGVLNDTKMLHWTTLNSIDINSNSDKVDGFSDFASHYTSRSHLRKKP